MLAMPHHVELNFLKLFKAKFVLDMSSACLACVLEVFRTCHGLHASKTYVRRVRQAQDNTVFRVYSAVVSHSMEAKGW